ncbi:efflux transporter outer membrane subunit [Sphingobium chlorophenolicum]|uniref:RND efflux system, outer membrane lipoprotein, NodT family n=1 Tax=Sphingobium chlorophenolicum TaxID=46429 RepID=A0A081REC0_SPHCR|nr:efflux transporter outer membrane subunit [Sphingobium chlorophenolicum]KEQ53543.1 RND efflux system, outer membrane lipoprotein, NodT family [Sphingobium chlorophenolicum]
MRTLSILLLSLSVGGCATGPAYHRPDVRLTEQFSAQPSLQQAKTDWWREFNDPLLDRIVDRALAQNLDLAVAAARVAQARAAAGAAGAALLPTLDGGASAAANRQSTHSSIGRVAQRLGMPRNYEQYDVGAQASWEIDLFGGLSGERRAARAEYAGNLADQEAVRLSVVAEVVDAYLNMRGLQAQLAVAEKQVGIESSLVDLIRQRVGQGIAAERELNRVLGEQRGVEASIAPLRAGIAAQMNRLDILMGQQAGTDRAELSIAAATPGALLPRGDANPAELLRRRPDIVAAERRLVAANARIGAAMAEYYPHLTLSGLFDVISLGTSNLFTGGSVQASGGAGIRWRLFDFGRIDADVAQARGREAEALARYRSSVLRATEDVETALVQLSEGRVQIDKLEQQVAALTIARDQARHAYENGAVALLDVLDADQAVLDASSRLEQARAGVARASVAAIRALGGGYREI